MKPWMADKEIATILKYLRKNDIMLEWGSGGSTVFFSKFVKEYYSIEHQRNWFDKINRLIKNSGVRYSYVPANIETTRAVSYNQFKDYTEKPKDFNVKFNKVLIDGRARLFCGRFIVNYLHNNSIVFVHDFWKKTRVNYRPLLKIYDEVESVTDTTQTLIVLKKKR